MKYFLPRCVAMGVVAFFSGNVFALDYSSSVAMVPVPGNGSKIEFLGDTFEEDGWKFIHNHPKSSREEDGR
ncbi:MAG: hypothetical protein HON07_07730, partial [Planctomycetaceae bacterium]|nr:hypothetical protein [Planctomycetaceae bacterium]